MVYASIPGYIVRQLCHSMVLCAPGRWNNYNAYKHISDMLFKHTPFMNTIFYTDFVKLGIN